MEGQVILISATAAWAGGEFLLRIFSPQSQHILTSKLIPVRQHVTRKTILMRFSPYRIFFPIRRRVSTW